MHDDRVRQFAHDLANVTMTLMGFMDTIPPALVGNLPYHKQARRDLGRILTLLQTMQSEAQGQVLDLVEHTASELWEMFRAATEDQHLPVHFQTAPCPEDSQGRYWAEPKRIDRIVLNIVQNAHAAGATEVRVRSASPEGGGCALTFLDNGKGMSPAELHRIGVPYTTENGRVHGEGCRIIRALCAEMGAPVYWESIEGLGTKVTIQWPAVAPTGNPHVSAGTTS